MGTTENEMVGWQHRFDRHKFEQALGDGEGQGSLARCNPRGHDWATEQQHSCKESSLALSSLCFVWFLLPCCLDPNLCLTLLQPHGLKLARLLYPWDFPGKNTGVGCPFLLQQIFPTQGLNPGLLHWQVGSLPLSHQGSPSVSLISENSFISCYVLLRGGLSTVLFSNFLSLVLRSLIFRYLVSKCTKLKLCAFL